MSQENFGYSRGCVKNLQVICVDARDIDLLSSDGTVFFRFVLSAVLTAVLPLCSSGCSSPLDGTAYFFSPLFLTYFPSV